MKLIFFNRFFFPDNSATSQLLSDLAFHLAVRFEQVHVVTSRVPDADTMIETIRNVTVHRIANAQVGHSLSQRAFAYARFYLGARRLAKKLINPGDIVVLKTDPPMLSVAIGPVARRNGAIIVNWLQDLFPEVAERSAVPGAQGLSGNILRTIRNRSLASAARTVVIGERMADYVKTLRAVPSDTIDIIHNWADGEVIHPTSRVDNPLRRKWLLDDKFVVGYSGNLGRVHEFDTLLAAAKQMRDKYPDICFLIIGRGPRLQEVMERVRTNGLSNVRFEPHQKQESLSVSLGVADVHLSTLSPQFEGLVHPSKLYGVLAAGRPTIFIGDLQSETSRILAESDAGMTVRNGESEILASMIIALRDAPGRRVAMGANARQAFESKYDRRLALAKWESLLTSLVR